MHIKSRLIVAGRQEKVHAQQNIELQSARDKPSARECSATYWGEEKAPRLASILAKSRPEDAPANPRPASKAHSL
jgi:hypothetical protein